METVRPTAPPVEEVAVQGRQAAGMAAEYGKRDAALGPLGTRSLLETPFSIMAVPRDVIVNQQSRNANDLAQYLPSVQLEMRGDPNTSRPQSRGFEADVIANSRMDGLNMVITTPYAAEMFDSLQVLNGLSGALYGPQNPAGTFDYTLNRPTDQRREHLVFGVDSTGAPLESLDASGRAGHGKWFGYRVTMLNQSGSTYASGTHLRRGLIAGAFDLRLDAKTQIQIDASQYSYAQRGYAGGFSFATGIALPSAPDLSRPGYGQDFAGYNASTNTALAKVIRKFSADWSLTLGGLYQDAWRNVFGVTNQLTDSHGHYRSTISAATTANDFRVWSNMAYLNGAFRTGPFAHKIVLGSNGYSMGNYNPTLGASQVLGTAQIGSPVVFAGSQPYFSGRYQSAFIQTQSLMAGDTIALTRHLSVMGTLAWSWLDTTSSNKAGVRTASYDASAVFTPMTSLIYRLNEKTSFYGTWGRSVQAGPVAPASSANANNVLAPLRSEEYELGAKYRPFAGLMLSAAGFRMTRGYAFTDPVSGLYREAGQQRNYGVEGQIAGRVSKSLSAIGGVTWLDAQVGATGSSLTSHKQVVGVAPVQASMLLDYHPDWMRGGAVNASVHYVGRRAADNENRQFVGSFATLDLGARYGFHVYNTPMVIRFGVSNVTDARYWASVYPSSTDGGTGATNSAVAGLPRTYHATTEIDF
ncbi:TonB-dependent ferric iron siderophore receptor [Asaia krungthepensis NRIC 0535]|uniref:TonB-dependent ferric iron siderophore receptor n=1 Tax=Asaia krungthepensis NRIC 0535 TaxID=1307925 RepID=A0ABQ0Q400_9PROT|nr:TonB-dependent ferric iron siderophore receptor [Asaia krungthepensis NRIC 0535]